jgi:hypothetical protein
VRIHLAGGTPDSTNTGIAAAWNVHSSIRWKEDITDLRGALGIVNRMRPVRYRWKTGGGRDLGFIAEELRLVLPEVVQDDPQDKRYAMGLDYARLTSVLTAAVQDMNRVVSISSAPLDRPSLVVDSNGNVGVGVQEPQRPLHIKDVLRLQPRAAAPADPAEGDLYVDSADHHIYCYLGGRWKSLDR